MRVYKSRYVLQPYWNRLVLLIPLWMAPNLITMIGFSAMVLNFAGMLYYDPYLQDSLPSWLYLSCAAGLWIYQSLDAIDGKQARRTSSSSPLGEMFDHGCDALNTSIGAILTASALNLGPNPALMWMTFILTNLNFYLSTWEELNTGTLYLGYFSGPVEGVIMLIGIFTISGLYGPSFWDQTWKQMFNLKFDRLPDAKLSILFVVFATILVIHCVFTALSNTLVHVAQKKRNMKSKKANMKYVSMFKVVNQILPFILVAGSTTVWWISIPSVKAHLTELMIATGFQFAGLVGRIILAHISMTDFDTYNAIMDVGTFIPCIMASLSLFQNYIPHLDSTVHLSCLRILLIASFFAYFIFAYHIIKEICELLNINCFRLGKRHQKMT